MEPNQIGYSEHPPNGNGVKRARTTMQLRSWQIERKQKSLKALIAELEKVQYPGIYVLFNPKKDRAYVGEAEHFPGRLSQHMSRPDDKIKDWSEVLVISDGRPITQSVFNNKSVREAIESYLNELLKANKYKVVASVRSPTLDQSQQYIVASLRDELYFFLAKKNIVTKPLEEQGQQEVYLDDVKIILRKKGIAVKELGEKEGVLKNGRKVFVRPGSAKKKGWQITIRGRKPGSFIDCARRGDGYLLVPRDGVLYIPLTVIQNFIPEAAFDKDTVDIFIDFSPSGVLLKYHQNNLDVTEHRLLG